MQPLYSNTWNKPKKKGCETLNVQLLPHWRAIDAPAVTASAWIKPLSDSLNPFGGLKKAANVSWIYLCTWCWWQGAGGGLQGLCETRWQCLWGNVIKKGQNSARQYCPEQVDISCWTMPYGEPVLECEEDRLAVRSCCGLARAPTSCSPGWLLFGWLRLKITSHMLWLHLVQNTQLIGV